jgi:hypothetical protein
MAGYFLIIIPINLKKIGINVGTAGNFKAVIISSQKHFAPS